MILTNIVNDPNHILTDDEVFKTTCTDKKQHEPASYGASHTTCKKCNQEVFMTNEGSGYYFTDKDCEEWDKIYNRGDDE